MSWGVPAFHVFPTIRDISGVSAVSNPVEFRNEIGQWIARIELDISLIVWWHSVRFLSYSKHDHPDDVLGVAIFIPL